LELYVTELLFANRFADIVNVLKKAIELWHSIGDRLREGKGLAWLTIVNYVIGQKAEAEQASRSAITILEALPASPELAQAYRGECYIRMEDRDCAEAVIWGEKAIALAEHFNDADTLARACNYSGCAMMIIDYERGCELMERSLTIGREANLPFAFGGTLANMSQMLVELYQLADAERYLIEGIAYATEHDDDYHIQEILTLQAMVSLYEGRWMEGVGTILKILQQPNVDLYTRTYALLTLGRLHVRQGDAAAPVVLDEALALSIQVDAIVRLAYTRAGRAEMAWLAGNSDRAVEEARAVYDVAVKKEHPWIAGELAFWRWRAGDNFIPPAWIAAPYELQIMGDWRRAAQEWEQRGYPYEQALALMDGDEAAQLAALDIFERLGARPAAEKLKSQMRSQGMRGIPRGHRPSTRQNRFNLTTRELEVLDSLVEPKQSGNCQKLSLPPHGQHHIASILQRCVNPSWGVTLKETRLLGDPHRSHLQANIGTFLAQYGCRHR
jgi:tetratricopeptide (TPR) repeat protein